MSYKYISSKICLNRASMIQEIETKLLEMGWNYIDGAVNNPALSIPYSDVNVTNDTFTKVGHTLVNGTPVQITTTTTLPTGFTINTLYYVVNVSGDTFKLSTTYGGVGLNLSSQGVGSHSIVEAFRIYSSNGEANDEITSYQIISSLATNGIVGRACYKYDLPTRTYICMTSSSYGNLELTTSETGFYIWIHGDKNIVHIGTKVSSTYYKSFFGFIKPFFNVVTTLTSTVTLSIVPVTLNVVSSVGFEVGMSYQIIGVSNEGRENVTVTAIGTGTITILSLVANYGINARIGLHPCLFGTSSTSSNCFGFLHPKNATALNSPTTGGYSPINSMFPIASIDPDYNTNKYILQPILFVHNIDYIGTNNSIIGYIDNNLLLSPSVGLLIEDTFSIGNITSGYTTGSNTTSIMYDTSKSWTINAYIDKVLIITFGVGSGMIKKIISNTATSLTISDDHLFENIPDINCQYIICNEGYRYFASGTGTGILTFLTLKEGV